MKLFDVYPLFDVNIVKGKGCKVWDDKGQEYLDLYGGHAVISIGHSHPHYISKVTEQLQNIGFYSNSVINKLQVQSRGILQSAVAGGAESAILLTDIYDGVGKVAETGYGGMFGAVVDYNNLAFILPERQGHDALDALAQQGLGQVVGRDDKTD